MRHYSTAGRAHTWLGVVNGREVYGYVNIWVMGGRLFLAMFRRR